MKVTLINHSDSLGGASVAAMNLLEALRLSGVDARMVVKHCANPANPFVSALPGNGTLPFLAEHASIFLHNGLSRRTLFKLSTASAGMDVAAHPWVREADVVHLHWFNQGMMSLRGLSALAALGKPVVWTMHDLWPATALCHHPAACTRFTTGCSSCPMLPSALNSLTHFSRRVFHKKSRVYSSLAFRPVAVSRWSAQTMAQSPLFRGMHIDAISNPFPTGLFASAAPTAGLVQPARKTVLFAAARLDDSVKNFPGAVEALNIAGSRRPLHALLVGEIRNPALLRALKVPYTHLPSQPYRAMPGIYAAADILLSPSHYETLGNTLVEAMAAGATPVAFGGDGRNDVINHLANGFLARKDDVANLAQGILWAVDAALPRAAQKQCAHLNFGFEAIAQKYIAIYNK